VHCRHDGRHHARLERQQALRAMDPEALRAEHPELAQWLSDPHNAAISHDELPVLKRIGQAVRQLTATGADDPLGLLPAGFTFVALKSSVGNFATSKKSGLLRWPSRSPLPVSMLEASMLAAIAVAPGFFASKSMVPENFLNDPRTHETIRCFTLKETVEWTGSMS
jgi:hypothetical protein